jgi:peptidyl-prolyl cis-trans isomerase SurA
VNVKTKLSDFLRPLLLGTLLFGSLVQAEVQPLDRVVAIVDSDVIMQSQLDQRVGEVQKSIAKQGGNQPPLQVLQPQVLERLILENLQLQIGDRAGVRITDEELNQALETIAQRNNMNLDQLRMALQQDGLSFNAAREQIRREMIISRVRQRRVADRVEVSAQEVKSFMASEHGQIQLSEEFHLANIRLTLPEGSTAAVIEKAAAQAQQVYQQLQQGASFTDTAVRLSAGEDALEGGDMGWRKAAQLPPPFDTLIPSLAPGQITPPVRTPGGFIIVKLLEKRGGKNQLRDEVHVRHILIKPSEIRTDAEAQKLAERLYERIVAGENFADLATSFSEDPGSARNGGDLDWIDPSMLVPEFQEVMKKSPSGQLSKPFKTGYGWHVLEVLGRRATDSSEQLREQQAMNILRNRKYDEELQGWLLEIRNEAYVEIKL